MPAPVIKMLIEDLVLARVFVCTAFDADGVMLCDFASPTRTGAIYGCAERLIFQQLLDDGAYRIQIEDMNPNENEE